MATDERIDELISTWLQETAPARIPERVLEHTAERTRRSRQQTSWRSVLARSSTPRSVPAAGGAAALVLLATLTVTLFSQLQVGREGSDLGIFNPIAGRIAFGDQDGIWGVDPASSDPATMVQVPSTAGRPLGWSSDGTLLLIQKSLENLFVLHADGSETQVTEQLSGFGTIPGSARPSGATISPDGSRVVFAGLSERGALCQNGALFAIDADGGSAELLWESQAQNGIVRDPTFSPDGTKIAFADGYCDHDHSVWVMNADGSDPHQIVSSDIPGAGHVYGLAWSPAGDRIALAFEGAIYTFATDGSDFTQIAGAYQFCENTGCADQIGPPASAPHWSPDGSQIAYATNCIQGLAGPSKDSCHLAIADADGSSVREFSSAMSGPWHPGTPSPSVEPTVSTSATPPATTAYGQLWPQTSLEEVRQAQELADAGDHRYTWQVAPELGNGQLAQHHPKDAEIFTRFLEEKLGWESYLWDEAFAHPEGLDDGDVVYIRCAPGGTNSLYPADPASPGCAPTIDERSYETVKINVAQLARQGPRGIWVVTGSEMIEPAEQVPPPSDAEITAFLEAFLLARIDGEGAEDYAGSAEDDLNAVERMNQGIPLLYATSSGAPYERSAFELVDGPVWPSGQMLFDVSLFADNGETTVEQRFSLERDESGRLRLVYNVQPDGPGTTENGKAMPVQYGFLDDEVTYSAAYPLEPANDGFNDSNRLGIDGLLPDDDTLRRVLVMLADPRPIEPGCAEAPAAADAEALARSIQSDPDFEATAPVSVTIGGAPALRMDVIGQPGGNSCDLLLKDAPFSVESRARLYLLDLPVGSQARVLAIATITDEDSFETVLDWAAPIVDSIEFHVTSP